MTKPQTRNAADANLLLDFLQSKHGSLCYCENRKWLLCTLTHETWGNSVRHVIRQSMKEHRRDKCMSKAER